MIISLILSETHETHHETAVGGNTSHAPADLPPWKDVLAGSPINTRYWHYEWPKQYMNGDYEWSFRQYEWRFVVRQSNGGSAPGKIPPPALVLLGSSSECLEHHSGVPRQSQLQLELARSSV
jgi:hypothetical protein